MRIRAATFFLACASVSCQSVPIDRVGTAQQELLALHEEVMQAHRNSDPGLLMQAEADDSISANRGVVSKPTRAARLERFEQYFGSTRFSEYVDVVPAIVVVSNDATTGWVISQVRARGVQTAADGSSHELSFESAWIELYRRVDGVWRRVGNVSNFKE